MILSTSPTAKLFCWLALLISLLWLDYSRLWMLGLIVLVLAFLFIAPQRWSRWSLFTGSAICFSILAIFLGKIIVGGLSWDFSREEINHFFRLGLAISGALGLSDSLREESLLLALLWHLGGAIAALTWLSARRQRQVEKDKSSIRMTRYAGKTPPAVAVERLIHYYWSLAPITAVSLAMRGYGQKKVTTPAFPTVRWFDLSLLAILTATIILITTL